MTLTSVFVTIFSKCEDFLAIPLAAREIANFVITLVVLHQTGVFLAETATLEARHFAPVVTANVLLE